LLAEEYQLSKEVIYI